MPNFYSVSARHYDLDYAALGYADDIPFYVDLAAGAGGPVLEMGCGTGRILLPIARAGVRIHGLDASPDMLAVLRGALVREPTEVQQRVSLIEGDLRDASIEGRFALVTAPFRVVQHLLERDDQRAWLRNVRRHLAPGGALCFDVFQPDFVLMTKLGQPTVELERNDPTSGRRVRRLAQTVPHFETQRLDIRFRWMAEGTDGSEVLLDTVEFTMRWFTRGEIENLLELEGFRITDYWGSFRREAFGTGSRQQIVRAVLLEA
ncbi:MAG: class I SAM-dependent methyltransferase [Acidobacteria bacterium]|nr:class I SAM-dependent methyltransferase [Acidobacteriota bacterium]